jgi:hypothetical protein
MISGGPDARGRYSEYLVQRAEVRDLEKALEGQRKGAHRHFLWAFLAFSPAAFFPMLGLLPGVGLSILVALSVFVSLLELARGLQARGRFFRLLDVYEERKARLRKMGPF